MKKPELWNKWIFTVVAAIGLLDSLYLIWIKIANDKAYCLQGVGDCWTVNTSKYSEIFGIPISVIGTIAYLVIIIVVVLENRYQVLRSHGLNILFGFTLTGILYSAYLTYLELFVIKAICPFCVLSAICMTILFVITTVRLVKSQAEN